MTLKGSCRAAYALKFCSINSLLKEIASGTGTFEGSFTSGKPVQRASCDSPKTLKHAIILIVKQHPRMFQQIIKHNNLI